MDGDPEKQVVVFHNVVSPYRLPLFSSLAEKTDLKVLFAKRNEQGRKWDTSIESHNTEFKYEFLPGFQIGPLTVNYSLPVKLLQEKSDVYIVSDTRQMLLSMLIISFYSLVSETDIYYWTGWLDSDYSSETHQEHILMKLFVRIYRKFKDYIQTFSYIFADGFIAYSPESVEYLKARGADTQNTFVGGQVMPIETLPDSYESDKNNDDGLTVLYLGYLNNRKGVEYLLNAWGRLKRNNDSPAIAQATLMIAGSGPIEESLHVQAENIPDVSFLGYVSGNEKARCYKQADLFVLPTKHDPWGLVVNEAMHFGLPIIVTEAAGSKHLIQKENNGIIIEPRNSSDLHQAIQQLLLDEKEREKLASQSNNNSSASDVETGIQPFMKAIKGDNPSGDLLM
ncbi:MULTISPECIES: glycosyltransferase family 4 protein [Halorussus]|uniref:glycosyltransferase family 4 protein n=1 Tax=Halorussus TaxID=1070314 RepID=UPI000E20D197|nr:MULTISPECIES: glycosyltransferase family 4 protein [Halorussus]NHN58554.1 glycosyltransferase family 4 protein [Halorussus sp. JP-T4]